MKLKLSPDGVFLSLSGEHGLFMQGEPCIFVRLAGCNLKCSYCDADYSLAEEVETDEIVKRIKELPNVNILVTGGEPLLQERGVRDLFEKLLKESGNYRFQIETNGTLQPEKELYHMVDCWVVDFKTLEIEKIANRFLKSHFPSNNNKIVFKAVVEPIRLDEFLFASEPYFKELYEKYPGLCSKVKVSISPLMPSKSKVNSEQVGEYLSNFTDKFLKTIQLQKINCKYGANLCLNFQMHKLIGCP